MSLTGTSRARIRALTATAVALSTATALTLAGGAAVATRPATATPSTRLSGSDRFATAAAISVSMFSTGVPVVYLTTVATYADALAGAAAAGGRGPILFVQGDHLPPSTAAALARLVPRRLVVLGGTAAVSAATAAAAQAAAGHASMSRLAGLDRYGTAAAISADTFSPGVPVAYVATGLDYPDALSGAAAASGRGPVLLVAGGSVPTATLHELRRLAPRKLVVLGGSSVVSGAAAAAAQAAAGGVGLTRLAGVDRYATAVAISQATFSSRVPEAFVATGLDFPDALAGAAAAGGRGPVLLVTNTTVPNVVAGELRRLHAAKTTVLGPVSAVGASVASVVAGLSAQIIPAPSAAAVRAVAAAQAQLGKPYQWAGAGPASFDCSGLTAWVWKAAGVVLPHNAQAQDDLVVSIPVTAVKPGDLVFFESPVNHVGLVIGPDKMIEAAHTGTLVRVSTFLDRTDLNGAGRPLPSAA